MQGMAADAYNPRRLGLLLAPGGYVLAKWEVLPRWDFHGLQAGPSSALRCRIGGQVLDEPDCSIGEALT
jgi:hypothetical protein